MLSEKTHNLLRKLQLLFAALAGALGVLSSTVDLGKVGVIAAAILAACGYFVGYIAENDSETYFANKDIIEKDKDVNS